MNESSESGLWAISITGAAITVDSLTGGRLREPRKCRPDDGRIPEAFFAFRIFRKRAASIHIVVERRNRRRVMRCGPRVPGRADDSACSEECCLPGILREEERRRLLRCGPCRIAGRHSVVKAS